MTVSQGAVLLQLFLIILERVGAGPFIPQFVYCIPKLLQAWLCLTCGEEQGANTGLLLAALIFTVCIGHQDFHKRTIELTVDIVLSVRSSG